MLMAESFKRLNLICSALLNGGMVDAPHEALPEIVWDLGFNVLDETTARYAAFTLRRRWEGDGVD